MPDTVFHLQPMGRLANLMIEYMVALKFADMVKGCRISNISIPAWGIHHPMLEPTGITAVEQQEQHINLASLAERMTGGHIDRVDWTGFGQRMENLLPASRYQDVFTSPFQHPMGFGPEFLVCPIRAEDILHGPNPEYVLTPVEFYQDIVAMTGLTPVFIGQTEPNLYMDRIVAAFPNAIVRQPQQDPLVDFETIRQSVHVVVGVSTYSWLAAWLSRSVQTIFMAVSGLYNPMQKPSVDLLPYGDPRYKFFLFPINYAVPLDQHIELHRRIAPYWREIPHQALQRQFVGSPRLERRIEDALTVFDDTYYLKINGDVAAVAESQGRGFARRHYIDHGFKERRLPMRLDQAWYASEYPLAAYEVARGDYAEFADHYMAIGQSRGYRPFSGA